jgi:acetaldehyde dehydrogenase (acetylating)
MVIHSMDEDIIMKFAIEKPAFRVLVNTQGALGAVGFTNELLPSMTLGPGTFGGSIISENVSAKHMFNVKRLAFETRPINPPDAEPAVSHSPASAPATAKREPAAVPHEPASFKPPVSHNPQTPIPKPVAAKSWLDEIEERIRLKAGNVPSQQRKDAPPHPEPSSGPLGTGISEEEVDRIMKDFSKR